MKNNLTSTILVIMSGLAAYYANADSFLGAWLALFSAVTGFTGFMIFIIPRIEN